MHRRHGFRHGCGPEAFRRRLRREEWLARLEEYQGDLEQELADVADLVRRLKEKKPTEATTV
jgi:hypothetical protein